MKLILLTLVLVLVVPPAGATRQILVHRTQNSSAATPTYFAIGGGHDASASSSDLIDCPMPIPGNYVELDFGVATAPGAGKSATSTFYKNGSASAMTSIISDVAVLATTNRTAVSVASGDVVHVRGTTSGGPSIRPMHRLVFDSIQTGWSFLCAQSNDDTVSSSPEYMSFTGTTSTGAAPVCATQDDCRTMIPVASKVAYLQIITDVAPGFAGSSYTFTVTDGTSDTAITCMIEQSALLTRNGYYYCEDLTHSATLTAEDWITLKIDLTDGGLGINLPKVAAGLGFRADNGDVFLIPFSSHGSGTFGNLSASANRFSRINASSVYEGPAAAERTEQSSGHAMAIKAMTVQLQSAPGSGRSYQMTLQEDATDTAVTVSIAGTDAVETWTGSVETVEYDLLRTKTVPTTTPTVTRGAVTYAAVSRPRRPIVMEAEEIGVEHGP